jgi:phenylalanyl-tRNA synthetase beta chain
VGLEEEAIHGGEITGPLIVGRVLEFADEPQKNGKTIRWCQVDVGSSNAPTADGTLAPRGIVCAQLRRGDPVVVALPGAVLAGGFDQRAGPTARSDDDLLRPRLGLERPRRDHPVGRVGSPTPAR